MNTVLPTDKRPFDQTLNAAIAASAQLFVETNNLDVILKETVEIIREVIGMDRAGVFLYDHDSKIWTGAYGTDAEGRVRDEHRLQMPTNEQHPMHRIERECRDEFFFENYQQSFPDDHTMNGVSHCYFVALRAHGKLIGGISVDNMTTGRPIDLSVQNKLRRFAKFTALALENNELIRRLSTANQQLERANTDLNDFANVVSHDLTAPLQGVLLTLELVENKYGKILPEEVRERLGQTEQNVIKMGRLLHGILNYSRSTQVEIDSQIIDTGDAVAEVMDMLAIPEGITINVQENMPSVVYDNVQLHQIFQNLIGNAVKYMGRNTGQISITCSSLERAYEFGVIDNGIGIPQEAQKRIFTMFDRGAQTHDDGQSAGVGLALVSKIVQRSGGNVRVESAPGKGSSFYFTIPFFKYRRMS